MSKWRASTRGWPRRSGARGCSRRSELVGKALARAILDTWREARTMATSDYCTQIAPSGSGGMRCGPASCASVLLSEGWQSDPWELTLQLDAKVDPQKDGTTSQDLLALMAGYGFAGGLWYAWD